MLARTVRLKEMMGATISLAAKEPPVVVQAVRVQMAAQRLAMAQAMILPEHPLRRFTQPAEMGPVVAQAHRTGEMAGRVRTHPITEVPVWLLSGINIKTNGSLCTN